MYSFSIKVSIYKLIIHVKIAPKISEVINKFSKRKKWKEVELRESEEVHGYAVSANDCINYYIFYDTESATPNYITHEVSHIIDYILEEKDIERTGEARAYLTGFISEKIFDFVLKKGILISKYIPKKEVHKPINSEENETPSGLL